MLFPSQALKQVWFEEAYALHFCSVALVPSPMRQAHCQAIDMALAAGTLISFDPNVRLPLWSDHGALKETILEFIPVSYTHLAVYKRQTIIRSRRCFNEDSKIQPPERGD